MAPATDTGSGKDIVTSMDVVVQRLDSLEEMLCVLTGKVGSLTDKVGDIDNQQQALGVTLICLEKQVSGGSGNDSVPYTLSAAIPAAALGAIVDGNPVAP
jgi:hypothetical protein